MLFCEGTCLQFFLRCPKWRIFSLGVHQPAGPKPPENGRGSEKCRQPLLRHLYNYRYKNFKIVSNVDRIEYFALRTANVI